MNRLFKFLLFASILLCGPAAVPPGFWSGPTAAPAYSPATDATFVEILDADTMIGSVTDNTAFSPWTKTIGNDATQATANNRPIWRNAANGVNGHAMVSFNDVTYDKSIATATFGTLTQPFRIWLVFKLANVSASNMVICGLGDYNGYLFNSAAPAWNAGCDTNVAFGTVDTNWHIMELVFDGAASTWAVDGGAPSTVDFGTASYTGIRLGVSVAGYSSGEDIAWVGVQNSLDTARTDTLGWLRTRFATY